MWINHLLRCTIAKRLDLFGRDRLEFDIVQDTVRNLTQCVGVSPVDQQILDSKSEYDIPLGTQICCNFYHLGSFVICRNEEFVQDRGDLVTK